MTAPFFFAYAVLWTTLMRALLVKANVLPATCARCGRLFERRTLGQPVCTCHSSG